MKNNIKTLAIIFTLLLSFSSCETDDDLIFTAAPQGEFELNNTFLSEYTLPAENATNNNIGAIFTFNEADFDVQTNVSYELQSSILGDFTDATTVPSISNENTQIEISIGTLKTLAEEYGIVAPNSGVLNFRVRAFPGDSASTTEMFTPIQQLTVTLLEETSGGSSGIEPATWGIIGDGYNNWGDGGPDGQFYTTSEAGVLVAYVTLIDGEIKFRENNAWDSNLGAGEAEGSLESGGANIPVTAGTYKITMNTNENTYTMEDYSWGVVGDGYNNWGETPDAKFYYDYTTDTFKVDVKLLDGEVKFRLNNSWDVEFEGDNIPVTAGHYSISINLNDNSYTLEESDVWGIVGDAWGETPDFSLTQIQPGIYVGDIATFVDGEIKFRLNSAWDADYGDNGADGTLDAGGESIAVTAGLYRVQMDVANGTYMLNKIQ